LFNRLPAGRYEITAGSTDYSAIYLKDPAGEPQPLSVEITPGGAIRHDLVLTGAVSVIQGTAEHAGVTQIGAFVLLIPKNQSERWAYRVDQTDSDGSYRLATIQAGDYFLIALSDGENVSYRDAKVAAILARAAKPVHLDAGNHVDLTLDMVGTASLNLPSL
jgi:hypothetical protein